MKSLKQIEANREKMSEKRESKFGSKSETNFNQSSKKMVIQYNLRHLPGANKILNYL